MAGNTVFARLTAAQSEINKASFRNKKRATARNAFEATVKAWQDYSLNPSTDTWNRLQTVGSTLDVALRDMRGEHVGAPGTFPPCVTGRESWCKKPNIGVEN